MEKFLSSQEIARTKPELPICIFRNKQIPPIVQSFNNHLNSKIIYAIKANPHWTILKTLYKSGIKDFDAASIDEIKRIYQLLPMAIIHYLHPIKSFNAIKQAFFEFKVRTFSLDSFSELTKIIAATKIQANTNNNLRLIIRIDVSSEFSLHKLQGKFGASFPETLKLLQHARPYCDKLGLSFHIGSQCINPKAFKTAFGQIKKIMESTDCKVDIIDIGGGFPENYINSYPPSLAKFGKVITQLKYELDPLHKIELWAEPGRALVARACSYLLKITARRKNILYLNDGTYGALFDLANTSLIYPTSALRPDLTKGEFTHDLNHFSFYGPTCDSIDFIKGPYCLPANIEEGDYLEIWQLGAYSQALKSNFNGFSQEQEIATSGEFIHPNNYLSNSNYLTNNNFQEQIALDISDFTDNDKPFAFYFPYYYHFFNQQILHKFKCHYFYQPKIINSHWQNQ